MPAARIWVRVEAHGFHCWPEAPERRGYLRAPHRHLFVLTASCDVAHDDREVEFHDLQDAARDALQRLGSDHGAFGRASCEDIARAVGSALAGQFRRPFMVEVSEDGECGAVVEVKSEGRRGEPGGQGA